MLRALHTVPLFGFVKKTTGRDFKVILCFQWSFRAQEPLLTLRRTLFTLAQQTTGHDFDHEIGHWWLWSAKIARK